MRGADMKKTVHFSAVAAGAAVFFAACTIWRPQLLRLLWVSVLDVALPPLWGGLLALLLAPPYRRLCALLGGGRTARCCALVLCYTGVLGMLAGAALLLLESESSGERLLQETLAILEDEERRREMEERMTALGIRDANERIYDTVMAVVKRAK